MRFDWGLDGLHSIAPGADVVVIVDVLPGSTPGADRLVARVPKETQAVLGAGLTNRRAVAGWIRARQAETQGRFTVSIVAVGEPVAAGPDAAGVRFSVEDHFAAGALVDALADTGIDYHSPEAAAACASFTALRGGLRQLIRASGAGRALIAQGGVDLLEQATRLDESQDVPILAEWDDRF